MSGQAITMRERTPKQMRTLGYLLSRAGLDPQDDMTRDYFERITGKRRRTDMDFYEMRRLINEISAEHGIEINGKKATLGAGEPPTARKARQSPEAEITREQRDMIFSMCQQLGIIGGKAQSGICRKATGKAFPATVGDGQKVIEALKHIERRGGLKTGEPEMEPNGEPKGGDVIEMRRRRGSLTPVEYAVNKIIEESMKGREHNPEDNNKGA